jgi:hypothetical protein
MYRAAVAIRASEMALFSIDEKEQVAVLPARLHVRPDQPDAETRKAAVAAFKAMIDVWAGRARDGGCGIKDTDGPNGKQFCLIHFGCVDDRLTGAAAFIVRRPTIADAHIALQRVRQERIFA